MRDLYYIARIMRSDNGLRVMLIVLYSIGVYRFFQSGADYRIFMGMFRIMDDSFAESLSANLFSIMYMVAGVAVPLGCFSKFLMIPDCFVYVRSSRTVARLARGLFLLCAYCCVYSGVQLAIAACIMPARDCGTLLVTAVCSTWMLGMLHLICNLGYLCGNAAMGVCAAATAYGGLLSLRGVMRWLLSNGLFGLPVWVGLFFLVTMALFIANYCAFMRMEIL